ncbi:hypothetical protein KBI23_10745 [bacterium]|nr:hypothetical protein [bacterium]MBP9810296.1 hypothetical protein [bacterium]
MADINASVADRTKVSEQLPVVDFGAWAQASTAYSNKGLAAVENRAKGLPAGFNQDFQISGLDLSVPEGGKGKGVSHLAKADANAVGKTAGNKFDATAVATELHQALNPKLLSLQFGADSDKAFNTLKNVTPEQYKAVDKAYSELVGLAGGSSSFEKGSSLEKKAASVDARLGQLIESKKHNDVPEEQRVTGEQLLKAGMIVHGDSDKTLPYEGGMGSVSRKMDWLVGTNLEKSAPYMQAEVWKKANQCDGPVEVKTQGDVTERNYTGCKVGEVKEYIVKGGEHGLHDYKNDGSRMVQWMLGRADRRQASSTEGAKFLTKHIVSDLSGK